MRKPDFYCPDNREIGNADEGVEGEFNVKIRIRKGFIIKFDHE